MNEKKLQKKISRILYSSIARDPFGVFMSEPISAIAKRIISAVERGAGNAKKKK